MKGSLHLSIHVLYKHFKFLWHLVAKFSLDAWALVELSIILTSLNFPALQVQQAHKSFITNPKVYGNMEVHLYIPIFEGGSALGCVVLWYLKYSRAPSGQNATMHSKALPYHWQEIKACKVSDHFYLFRMGNHSWFSSNHACLTWSNIGSILQMITNLLSLKSHQTHL